MSRSVIKVLLDVNTLELVGDRTLPEIEQILSNPGHKKELLWRAPDGEWWVHIQREASAERYYEVMVRDSHDDMLLYLLYSTLKQVEQQTPFRLCDFRITDAWINQREWVL
jgi:hypothetical protein